MPRLRHPAGGRRVRGPRRGRCDASDHRAARSAGPIALAALGRSASTLPPLAERRHLVTLRRTRRGQAADGRRARARAGRRLHHDQGRAAAARRRRDAGRGLPAHQRQPDRSRRASATRASRRAARGAPVRDRRPRRDRLRAAHRRPARPDRRRRSTRSSPTPRPPPTSTPRSTRSSRSAARTPSTPTSTNGVPSRLRHERGLLARARARSSRRRPRRASASTCRRDRASIALRAASAAELQRPVRGLHRLGHQERRPRRDCRDDIVAGLVYSICMNYNNRVKGYRAGGPQDLHAGRRLLQPGGAAGHGRAAGQADRRAARARPDGRLRRGAGGARSLSERPRRAAGVRSERAGGSARSPAYAPFACGGGREQCDYRCPVEAVEVRGQPHLFGGLCRGTSA